MGKFNLAQKYASQEPMLAVRQKLIEKKKMEQTVKETLEKQKQAQLVAANAASVLATKNGQSKSSKAATKTKKRLSASQKENYNLLTSLKGAGNHDLQTLKLLNQLEQQFDKKQSDSEETANTLLNNRETIKQLELLKKQQKQAQEEELMQQERDQEQAQLQGLLALQQGLSHAETCDADDEMGEEEDEEEENQKMQQKKNLQEQLRKMIRDSQNNAKLNREKKEYLERHSKEQSKRLEKNMEKMMREQKLLLQHISNLTAGKPSENADDKCDSDEDDELPEQPAKTKKTNSTRTKKQSAPTAASGGSSEAQLIKYLQSLG